jgi:hypothetical protein
MEQYYYSPSLGQTYSAFQMQVLFGINVETASLEAINYRGFYPVQESTPDFDIFLYIPVYTWTLTPITGGEGAVRVYTPDPKPLPEAKENASYEVIEAANNEQAQIVATSGFSTDTLTAVSSQDPLSRPIEYQATFDAMVAVSDQLASNLSAIDAATTVDEINNIVNKPTGTLFTGRGAGLGPEDLNVSYYTAFNSVSMTEAETELFVPGTSTVIAYGSGGPGQFDSTGNCFNPGDYLIQVRETATGMVIAEFDVPLNPAGEDVAF